MICDTHTHSIHSFDGSESVRDMCIAAIKRGVCVLAVTDHAEAMEGVPYIPFERKRVAKAWDDIDAARREFGDKLDILFGCELGQPHLNPEYARAICSEFSFDYIIGSLHFFRKNVDLYDVIYTRADVNSRISEYFRDTLAMIETGGFQALGHLDYILRRLQTCFDGLPTYRGFERDIDMVLEAVIERNMALEVNTSGMRKWLNAIGLEPWVLTRFRELGGKYVTIGSDAHNACDIGAGFSDACRLLKSCGFEAFTYYKEKIPVLTKI
ncbi:MAG: histidinol-phosphatase HisJ family protein [Clostridia bacterium]